MATSELGHYVRFSESQLDADRFADAGMCRRALGNLDHIADQYAQVRVAAVYPANTSLYLEPDSPVENEWARIIAYGPFDLHIKATGESYGCRTRLAIATSVNTNQSQFRAVLAPMGASEADLYAAGANVASLNTSSSTVAWVNGSALLYLDAEQVRRATATVASIDGVSGTERAATWLRATLTVFGKGISGATVPRLYGAWLAEYLGP